MMHFRTARVAIVALTAIGMIFTTTAHAAGYETGPASIYGNNPPTDPGHPTVPGHPGPVVELRPDISVTLMGQSHVGENYEATFRIENIGNATASSVKIHAYIFHEKGKADLDRPITPLGAMAPGARASVVVKCKVARGNVPCLFATAQAWLTDDITTRWDNDANWYNNIGLVEWP